MKKQTIEIPIYQGELTMILDSDLSYIEKEYKTPSLKDFGAITLKHPSDYRHYIVAFEAIDLSLIAHEVAHIKNEIYTDCAMMLDTINDEPEAYLTGWLFEQIYKFLKDM